MLLRWASAKMALGPGLGELFLLRGASPAICPLSWEVGGSSFEFQLSHLFPALKRTQGDPWQNDGLGLFNITDFPFSCFGVPEAPSIRGTGVIGAGHLRIRNVWEGSLRVADMGKVPLGERGWEVGLALCGRFPILTISFSIS